MSVTVMICDPASALRRFLDSRLPQRSRVVDVWLDQLRTAPRGSLALKADHSRLGLAFEMRVGLDLAECPGPWGVLQCLLPSECERLLVSAGFSCSLLDIETGTTDPLLRGWARTSHPVRVDSREQRDALTACYLATYMNEIDHKIGAEYPVEARRWLLQLHRKTVGAEGLSGVGEETLVGLLDLWDGYVRFGRTLLMDLGERVIVSPTLVPGFAVADLIIGRTLIDIKTYRDPAKELDLWLDQVLSYALLDRWNLLGLDGIAIYLGWHSLLLRVGFGDLLDTGGVNSQETMATLRRDFNEAIRDDLDEAACRQMARRFPPLSAT